MRTTRILTAAFYLGLGLLVALILGDALHHVLGTELATRVARSSEGFAAALILAPWLQLAVPRIRRGQLRWLVPVVAAAALGLGVILYVTDLPSRFRTLNETFLALAILLPWTAAARPLTPARRWAPAALGAVAVTVGTVTSHPLVVTFAEAEILLVVATVGLELVDRGVLVPTAHNRTTVRWVWYVSLAVGVLLTFLMTYPAGEPETLARYLSRGCEAYLCMLLVQMFLAVVLGRTGSGEGGIAVPAPVTAPAGS